MTLLAIDSFSERLSVALLNGESFFSAHEDGLKHSERLMDLTDDLFKQAEITPSCLNGVLCMEGPGSFTGLRIAYSACKGLSLSLSIPFAAIPTSECIAHSLKNKDTILTLINARKNAWFYAFFNNEKRLCPDADGDYPQIEKDINIYKKHDEKIILTGPGSSLFYEAAPQCNKDIFIIKNVNEGYAKDLISIALEKNVFEKDNSQFLFSGPQYLRKSDAELNS